METQRLKNVLIGPATIDKQQIIWARSFVTATVAGLLVFLCILTDNKSAAIPLAIGAAFVGLTNFGEHRVNQMRSMAWCTIWLFVTSLIGGLVSNLGFAQIPFAMVIAMLAGFAGALGRRGALIGVLALVLFTVFSGAPDTEISALQTALLVVAGGVVQLLVASLIAFAAGSIHPLENPESIAQRLTRHRNRESEFARHALRLAIAIGVATAIGQGFGWPHDYWIPMTVVWMSKPSRDGTTTRVIERMVGTIAGIGVSVILVDHLGTGDLRFVVFVAAGTLLLLAFINANYPIAVVGITLVVVALFALNGDPVTPTADYRVASTLVAALITIAASFLFPGRNRNQHSQRQSDTH